MRTTQNEIRKLIIFIFVIWLYIACSCYAQDDPVFDFTRLLELRYNNAIGVNLVKSEGEVDLYISTRDYLAKYEAINYSPEKNEKFSLDFGDDSALPVRLPAGSVFLTESDFPRLWLSSNCLRSGAYHDFVRFTPFILMQGGQPITSGSTGIGDIVVVANFVKGTNYFDGEIGLYSVGNQREIYKTKLQPFFQISGINNSNNQTGSDDWKWLVLNIDNELIVFDEYFKSSFILPFKAGYFAQFVYAGKLFLFCTSLIDYQKERKDKIRIYKINLDSDAEPLLIGQIEFERKVWTISAIEDEECILLAVLTEDAFWKYVCLYRGDIDE